MEPATATTGADEVPPREAAPLCRDFVAGQWKTECFKSCKPSTQTGFRSMLNHRCQSAPRPYHPQHGAGLIRGVEPGRARFSQSYPRPAAPDPQPCPRLRAYRRQPGARYPPQSRPENDTVPLPRGDLPPSQCPRPLRQGFRVRGAAGRYHPPSAAHRLPQERANSWRI